MEDLLFAMFSPNGSTTQVNLFNQICTDNENFDLNIDDEALAGSIPCPPTDKGTYQPLTLLSTWDGQDANGSWQLAIVDGGPGDVGQLETWSIEVCYVGAACELTVTNTNATGTAALLETISCANSGSTITINLPAQSVIDLGSMNIIIDKNLTINSVNPVFIDYSGAGSALNLNENISLTLNNVEIRQVP